MQTPLRKTNLFKQWLPLLIIGAAIFAIYSNTYQVPFIFDDARNIDTINSRLTDLQFDSLVKAAFDGTLKTRPVSNLSFALNYYFGQKNLPSYHLVNIVIHFLNAALLYLFVQITMNLPTVRRRYGPAGWTPFIVALLWGVHPLNSQSVTYIVQRMNSMAAMFFLLSCLGYILGRLAEKPLWKWSLFLISLVAALLAFGSKENSFFLPVTIFIYEWFFLQDLSWKWLKRHCYLPISLLVAAIAMIFIFYGTNPLSALTKAYALRPFSLPERLLTEGRVVFFYLSLFFLPRPSRLNLLHDFPLSHSLVDPVTTIMAIGGILLLFGLAVYWGQKDRLLSFCIFWFLGGLLIESTFVPLEIIFEHRMYLPSMLVLLSCVLLYRRFIPSRYGAIAVILCIMTLLSFWTYERNKTWQNGLTFWQDCLAKSPSLGRVHNNYAYYLFRRGNRPAAEEEFETVLRLNPPGKVAGRAYYNLGVILSGRGEYRAAIRKYSEAVRLYPNNSEAQNNLGDMYERVGNLKAAAYHLGRAVSINPNDPFAQYNLGLVFAKQHNYQKAYEHFSETLRLNPNDRTAKKDLEVVKGLLEKEKGILMK